MSSKNILYSVLDLAIVSKGNSLTETFKNTLKLAQKAEEFGYTRFWLAEHHNSDYIASSATSVLIGYVAEGTSTIRVGSGGIMLPNHSPLIIAEQFGTLGSLYPNRIDLGLGRAPGTDQETAKAIRSDHREAAFTFPEEVGEIQKYFSLNNVSSNVRATIAEGVDVPLYILGSSTDSAYLSSKKGLPYAFASHFATAKLFDALKIYHEEFTPSEYLQKPYTMAGVNIIIADTDEEAEKISTSLYKIIIGLLTGKRDYMQEPTEMTPELREMVKHPSVHQMLKYSFIGSKETVKKQISEFIDKTKIDELIAVTNIYDAQDRIKSYKLFSEIMKELNEENS
ncbi:LLM class flavin-dependent oxidoreductase [Cellulophaga sp. HaHaR_3_176]|uniref:LLM class flavin-dependent oxidoreductase n=1 Tax=Cellulophaga sp. HaHaR_3_176 TaxID=1942464 RepID=UPI001C2003CE|nr:LLM class flavin-dependent oxidoreductase [Cellulophaga sp. HaHaR_3_176]QWX83896.1 LLM class flavin-dependent oxidoreductase [Cellulophaga sp. HaHaR_3_176]